MWLNKIFNSDQSIKEMLKSRSLKNVMVLMSGTLLSQALPILFFPILSRIYSPTDYGVLGLFMSISMLLTVLSNFQMNYALLIPKDDDEALQVFFTGSYLVLFFSAFALLLVALFGRILADLLATPLLSKWLYFLPVTIFFSGINIQLSAWFNRLGGFKTISTSRILTSVVTIAFSLLLSLSIQNEGGLIISYVLGTFASFLILMIAFMRTHRFMVVSIAQASLTIQRYRNFPLFTMPTEVISNFSQQLPLYIFSMFSGPDSVGLFNRSRQILALPINYLSASISEVYKQKASEAFRNDRQSLSGLFIRTLRYLILVSVIPFVLIGLLSPPLFAFFFGENWRDAGVFTQCLVFLYFFRFVVSPVTFNFYLFDKQRLDFILHLLIIVMTSAALYVGFVIFKSDVYALLLFSFTYSLIYLVYGVLSYRFTLSNPK